MVTKKISKDDPFLILARELILKHKNPSVAFLQRQLLMGHQQALKLIQQLEGDIVSAPDAEGTRHMLAVKD